MFMGTSYYDGVIFIPKQDIYFLGWGLFACYRGHDQTFKIQWKINEDRSAQHTVSFKHSERDPEKNWHEVDITTLGESPIFCPEGTKINVLAYPQTDDMRRIWYGEQGSSAHRDQIPDQDNIFDMMRSPEKYDSNEEFGQFPYILY